MFLVFFSIVIGVMTLGNLYIYRLGRWGIESPFFRKIYTVVFIFLAVSYLLGRAAQKFISYDHPAVYGIIFAGSIWLAMMTYLGIATFAVDLVTLGIKGISLAGVSVPAIETVRRTGSYIGWGFALIVVAAGYINAQHRIIREVPLVLDKHLEKKLTVVAVTDVHLGTLIDRKDLRVMVDRINALNPDIVIIGGDLFDEDLTPIINGNFGDYLSLLRAKYGVFAVTGNHEFFSGVDRAVDYMTRHGVKVLRSEMTDVGPVIIAGRDDRTIERVTGVKRPPLAKIVAGRDRKKPLIVIDHTPSNLDEARSVHADLQISGHTHHGQIWPYNFITGAIFEVSQGLVRVNGTAVYVSTGYGTWGPPIRTGNRPEIVKFEITGNR
jgi:hypothetical protein